MNEASASPCLACGACCASYRVSFYWSEGRLLPERLLEKLNDVMACMAGTNQPTPRCAALQGEVGREVSCDVYGMRPSPCREVQIGDERCNRARARCGLPPIN